MHKFLVFYAVSNSLNYGRHEFDNISKDGKAIFSKLAKLPPDEWKFYDLDASYDYNFYKHKIEGFVDDYNNEELDGGFWVVAFTMSV